MQELLTPSELANRLKVSHATITNWRRRGIIPAIRVNATTYRFSFEEAVAALRSLTPTADAKKITPPPTNGGRK